MQTLLTNWKTTALGIGTLCTALGTLFTHLSTGDTSTLGLSMTGILAGVGLIFGKDSNK